MFPQLYCLVFVHRSGGNDVFGRMTVHGEHDVRVAFESLYDLFRLKIPQINEIVFGTTYDPLPRRDGESGEDAIFVVLVPCICFQAFPGPLAIIPQAQRVIERAHQYKFAVGREPDERNTQEDCHRR